MQIVLKDKSGNPIAYDGVGQLEAAGYDNFGNATTHKYTNMAWLQAYAVSQQTDGRYLVQKRLQYIPTDNYFYFVLYNTEFEAFSKELTDGTSVVGVLVTPKSLVTGNTYTVEEMY